MATLEKFRESYYELSGKASDTARNLAFAGIAIIWIFRTGEGVANKIPQAIFWPLGLFAVALALDLFPLLSR